MESDLTTIVALCMKYYDTRSNTYDPTFVKGLATALFFTVNPHLVTTAPNDPSMLKRRVNAIVKLAVFKPEQGEPNEDPQECRPDREVDGRSDAVDGSAHQPQEQDPT